MYGIRGVKGVRIVHDLETGGQEGYSGGELLEEMKAWF